MVSGGSVHQGEDPWAMILRRLKQLCRQLTFYVVLVIGILILGYLSVWIEIVRIWEFKPTPDLPAPDLASLRLAYATAILAVGAPCVMQLFFTTNKMAILSGVVLIFGVLWLAYWVTNAFVGLYGVHCYGLLGLVVATLSWWLANGEDSLFQDRVMPNASSGGEISRALNGGNSGVQV